MKHSHMSNISMPQLTTTGGITIANNTLVRPPDFPQLSVVNASIIATTNTNLMSISFPSLNTVKGSIIVDGEFEKLERYALNEAWEDSATLESYVRKKLTNIPVYHLLPQSK